MMMTVFRILNVEQEIAKTKILFLIFQLVPTAAMTLFQVRCSENYLCYEIIVGKVHIFREGHKILQNLHRRFVLCSASQVYV